MNFLFLSTMGWDNAGGAYAPTRIGLEMARRGHAVVFCQMYKPLTPPDTRGLPIRVIGLDELGIPNLLVTLAWRGLYLGQMDGVMELLTVQLGEIFAGNEPQVAILNAPFDPFVRLLPFLQARGYYVVYFPQDDYADMERLGYREYNLSEEAHLVERADQVIALSKQVAKVLGKRRAEIEVVPDAVDPDEFRAQRGEPTPSEILRGEKATLGLWGNLISSMVDAPLLETIARAKPEWALNLIGPYDMDPSFAPVYEPLSQLANVRFLGPVAHSQLIRYGKAFDVCLLPGPDNDMSRGRDPLKFYEYLACYKPIVATHMPQLEGMPYVRVAYEPTQAIDAINAALQTLVDCARVDAFLAKNTWSVRGDAFFESVQTMVAQPPAQRGVLGAEQLEAFGRARNVGVLSRDEGAAILSLVRDYDVVRQQAQQLEIWAHSLEAANRTQQQALDRLHRLPPLRLASYLRNRLLPRGAQ